MSDPRPVQLSTNGPPETVLDQPIAEAREALELAMEAKDLDMRRESVSVVVARWPRYLEAWAELADVARDDIEAYAAYRVGYHRGLDQLRQSGWRGSGYVRWQHRTNRGFLRCVAGLQKFAAAIGEADEEERCAHFLHQLDPTWPPAELA